MHLLTIIAFAVLFWHGEDPGVWILVPQDDAFWTLLIALGHPLTIGVAAVLTTSRAQRLLEAQPASPDVAQRFHHRSNLLLRCWIGVGFAATVFLTRWPEWFAFSKITPVLQCVGDLIVLSPFVVNLLILWITAHPLERALHTSPTLGDSGGPDSIPEGWRFWTYLGFNFRHYFLVIAVPMLLVLFAANLTREYGSTLREWSGVVWMPDATLGAVAICVFFVAPLMLRSIWSTFPLEAGPLRERLEAACVRNRLRCREILVWQSHGIMINAAVMGLAAPVRFVLLSDALLSTMNMKQIEAVFGHEAGHVRHRHIQHFLLFAFVGWLVVAGLMELAARTLALSATSPAMSAAFVDGIGVVSTIVVWGVAFGWLSRRFERQADLFGARSVTPAAGECNIPCSVHPADNTVLDDEGRVCATGASVFASALDRVAWLNGIPHEERSWRHSSIGSRIRFLTSLAQDPSRIERFERTIDRVKTLLIAVAIGGAAIAGWYWIAVGEPAILQLHRAT